MGFSSARQCATCGDGEAALQRIALPFFEVDGRRLCPRCIAAHGIHGDPPPALTLPSGPSLAVQWPASGLDDAVLLRDAAAEVRAELEAPAAALIAALRGATPPIPLADAERRVAKHRDVDALQGLFGCYALWLAASGQRRDATGDDRAACHEAARQTALLVTPVRIRDRTDVALTLLRVSLDVATGQLDAAAQRLESAVRGTLPPEAGLRLQLALAFVHGQRGHSAAVDHALAQASQHAGPATPAERAALHRAQAARAIERQRWLDAETALAGYLAISPDDGSAWHARVLAALRRGQAGTAAAVAAAHEAVTALPDDGHAHYLLALAHHESGDFAAAAAEIDDRRAAQSPREAVLLAHAAARTGETARARRALEAVFAAHPSSADVQASLWHVLQDELVGALRSDSPPRCAALADLVADHADLLLRRFGAPHAWMLARFIHRELQVEGQAQAKLGLSAREAEVDTGSHDFTAMQTYALLAERNLGVALDKNARLRRANAAPVPVVLLGLLLQQAVHHWNAIDREMVCSQLRRVIDALRARLPTADDSGLG